MTKKQFPIEIVLSLTTGILLKQGGFGEMQELAEHVLGHPVWTHEFAEKALWEKMNEAVFAQHPSLRNAEVFERPAEDLDAYLDAYVSRAIARFGATLEIERGSVERTESPFANARRVIGDKPIVAVVVGEKDG